MISNIEKLSNIQKFLIGGFIEYGHAQDYKEVIPSKLFGIYEPMFKFLCENGNAKTPDFYNLCGEMGMSIFEAMDRGSIEFITQRDKYIEQMLDIYISEEISKKTTPMGILEKMKDTYLKLQNIRLGNNGGITKIDNLLFKLQDEIEEAVGYGDSKQGYPTGLGIIDKYAGGLVKGRTIRISAYSNVGKSSLSYFVANNVLKAGGKVLYFSLEIPKEDLRNRLLSNYYNIPIWKFESKKSSLAEFDMSEYATKELYLCCDVFTMTEIEKTTQIIKPDVVFIDYVQLVKGEGNTEYENMNDVARRIRQMTEDNNCACFDLSQISNESIRYKPGMTIPAKGSGELVSAANQILVMQESKFPGRINIHLAKNRHGMKRKCSEFTPDFLTSTFANEIEINPDDKDF